MAGHYRQLWRTIRSAASSWYRDESRSRGRRVVLMLLFLWVLSLFDLAFTVLAVRAGHFTEANPIARQFITSEQSLVLFKVGLLVPASLGLFVGRRRVETELGCYLLCIVYCGLAAMWVQYFGQ